MINGPQYLELRLSSPGPAVANRSAVIEAYVAIRREADADQFWVLQPGYDDGAKFALSEIHPVLSPGAEERIRLLIQRVVGRLVKQTVEEARTNLRQAGYPDPSALS